MICIQANIKNGFEIIGFQTLTELWKKRKAKQLFNEF